MVDYNGAHSRTRASELLIAPREVTDVFCDTHQLPSNAGQGRCRARDCVGEEVVTPLIDTSLKVYRTLPTVHFLIS
jgi:hypothetical protein